ncbi:unnamed protein product, partial [Meganyctiphanes norvegica]
AMAASARCNTPTNSSGRVVFILGSKPLRRHSHSSSKPIEREEEEFILGFKPPRRHSASTSRTKRYDGGAAEGGPAEVCKRQRTYSASVPNEQPLVDSHLFHRRRTHSETVQFDPEAGTLVAGTIPESPDASFWNQPLPYELSREEPRVPKKQKPKLWEQQAAVLEEQVKWRSNPQQQCNTNIHRELQEPVDDEESNKGPEERCKRLPREESWVTTITSVDWIALHSLTPAPKL